MVCVSPDDRVSESDARVQCIVRYIDENISTGSERYEGTFPASTPVKELIDAVAEKFKQDASDVHLQYQCNRGLLVFTERTEGTLGSIGLDTALGARNAMVLELPKSPGRRTRDWRTKEKIELEKYSLASGRRSLSDESNERCPSREPGYVGLVNQAMTCYLNSLLQALFMTPEFRNALYKWQFDPSQEALPQKCIPYQLQKLFLNLQTSNKPAVETTELTKSFGWESGEVWQQHDIQELCRVMFDALENEFKNTEQADLINRLYQGKMIDYVKCLECGKEKSKEDVFLDIPLPVRPFGSTVAYKDIDEALKAFVLPEILNDNNQYFCEACNKKCDAHKGLKFSTFPYLLTLHLKRFDFDYNIMHRIKLNDKVTFPEILDLNAFIQNTDTPLDGADVSIKCDDSSTADSALDEETNHIVNEAPPFDADQSNFATEVSTSQDDDEGIDLSNMSNNSQENEKNINQSLSRGPFVYELYSIMIHSGSASGGHYYAYIKDFSHGEWYCFNDQSVSPITREDIVKTYGGAPHRLYYNGAHSSSTNAYMLMYRQIDKSQNCQAMTNDDFPPHIQKILEEIKENEERERALKAKEEEMVKLKVFCNHPSASQRSCKVIIHNEESLADAMNIAYQQFRLENVVPEEQCRLVSFNKSKEYLELSFDGKEKCSIKEILNSTEQINRGINMDFMLETREKDKKFFPYNFGDVSMIVYLVDVENCDVISASYLRTSPCQTVGELKEFFREAIPIESKDIHVALSRNTNVRYLSDRDSPNSPPRPLNKVGFFSENRVFAAPAAPEDGDLSTNFEKSKFYKCVYELRNIILLQLSLPENLEDQCESLLIPLLDDKNESSKEAVEPNPDCVDAGPRINGVEEELAYSGASGMSDHSASEDSSLTDSERTIIGDTEVGTSDGRVSSGSDSEQLFSPAQPTSNIGQADEEVRDSNFTAVPKPPPQNLYFHAELITEVAGAPTPTGEQKVLKVAVDRQMDMEVFKTKLEGYVGVAGKYLKIFQTPELRSEVTSFFQNLDNDKIAIGLNRLLERDEFKARLYYLNTNNTKNQSQQNPMELIISKAKTVGDSKKDIAKELSKKGWKVPADRIRLRTKEWKSPGKILLDNAIWDEHVQQDSIELYFQNLDGPEKVNANTFLVAFTRWWHPSITTLGPFAEVVLDHQNEFLKKISEMSELPIENIEFTKGTSVFPCEMNVLDIDDLEWTTNEENLVSWKEGSCGSALVIFYRDSREELKSLTKEEEEEVTVRNDASNLPSPCKRKNSPRKERALKIYWESKSPSRIMDLD